MDAYLKWVQSMNLLFRAAKEGRLWNFVLALPRKERKKERKENKVSRQELQTKASDAQKKKGLITKYSRKKSKKKAIPGNHIEHSPKKLVSYTPSNGIVIA